MMLPPSPPLPDGSQDNEAEACLRQRLHFLTQLLWPASRDIEGVMPFRGIVPWEAISRVIQPCRCTSGRNLTVAQDCTPVWMNKYLSRVHILLYCAALPTPYSVGHSTAKCAGCGSGDRLVGYQGVVFFFPFLSFPPSCLSLFSFLPPPPPPPLPGA